MEDNSAQSTPVRPKVGGIVDNESQQAVVELASELVERLRGEYAKAVAHVQQLADAIEAIERTILAMSAATSLPQESAQQLLPHSLSAKGRISTSAYATHLTVEPNWRKRLQGLSHPQALVRIAEANNGLIRVKDATDIILKAGLSSSQPRNLYRYILTLLSNSPEFQKIGKGSYQLVVSHVRLCPATLFSDTSEDSEGD